MGGGMDRVGVGSFAVFIVHWDFVVGSWLRRVSVEVVRVVVIVSVHGRSHKIYNLNNKTK